MFKFTAGIKLAMLFFLQKGSQNHCIFVTQLRPMGWNSSRAMCLVLYLGHNTSKQRYRVAGREVVWWLHDYKYSSYNLNEQAIMYPCNIQNKVCSLCQNNSLFHLNQGNTSQFSQTTQITLKYIKDSLSWSLEYSALNSFLFVFFPNEHQVSPTITASSFEKKKKAELMNISSVLLRTSFKRSSALWCLTSSSLIIVS